MNVNITILGGRLTRDWEVITSKAGHDIGKNALAVTRKYKSSQGEAREETSFIDLVVWGKAANILASYTRKGSRLMVQGRLKQDTWEKDGKRQSRIVVNVDNFQLIDKLGADQPAQPAPPPPQRDTQQLFEDDDEPAI
jgi:single-strand DNA-binding protein